MGVLSNLRQIQTKNREFKLIYSSLIISYESRLQQKIEEFVILNIITQCSWNYWGRLVDNTRGMITFLSILYTYTIYNGVGINGESLSKTHIFNGKIRWRIFSRRKIKIVSDMIVLLKF